MKKALLIEIDNICDTEPHSSMNGCVDDTIQISNLLTDHLGYNSENIVLLCNDIEPMPTRVNIMTSLDILVSQSETLDEIWIYYSCKINDTIYADISNNLEENIVPINYNSEGVITNTEFFERISKIKCRTILVFDSFQNGKMCELEWGFEYRSPKHCILHKNPLRSLSNPNIIVYRGFRYNDDDGHPIGGSFTGAFIKCLAAQEYNYLSLYLYGDICTELWNLYKAHFIGEEHAKNEYKMTYNAFINEHSKWCRKPYFFTSSENCTYSFQKILSTPSVKNSVEPDTVKTKPAKIAPNFGMKMYRGMNQNISIVDNPVPQSINPSPINKPLFYSRRRVGNPSVKI